MTPGHRHLIPVLLVAAAAVAAPPAAPDPAPAFRVTEDAERIRIAGPALEAAVRKTGYVSGVEGGSLLDMKTGFRDLGTGWTSSTGSWSRAATRRTGTSSPATWRTTSTTWSTASGPSAASRGRRSAPRPRKLSPTVITGHGLRGGPAGLHLQAGRTREEDRLDVGADDRLPGRQAVLPVGRQGHHGERRATRCSSASTCRGTSSTRPATRSARCT